MSNNNSGIRIDTDIYSDADTDSDLNALAAQIIDENTIQAALTRSSAEQATPAQVNAILDKARELAGLTLDEVATLLYVSDPELLASIYATACYIKESIYGKRIVLFAPLYISNLCSNNCLYCAFRSANTALKRRALQQHEIIAETTSLVQQGHKRILLVAGETYPNNDFSYVTQAIENIYRVTSSLNPADAIRRINVLIAPLSVAEFVKLKECNIGTYQLFQETYNRAVYSEVHLSGKKTDYAWRLTAIDRAMQAGIDDVGIGALFGLADWRFEVLGLLQHAAHLQRRFDVGPHTISVPRLEPALGSELASNPRVKVSDEDFCKIVAILRLAVPYTGIIMSTRETPELRRATLELGVSQISAGSRTDPGGYTAVSDTKSKQVQTQQQRDDVVDNNLSASSTYSTSSQFSLGDHRELDEVVQDLATLGYLPSFCTACYRLGRTGEDFMCLAKPGIIKNMCGPNALITFQEYLLDHASPATRAVGEALIAKELASLSLQQRTAINKLLDALRSGKRDLFV